MKAAQLAASLEVSGWPKPGNIHRTADFEDTKFEQFIAGSIALGPVIRKTALRGIMFGRGLIKISELRLGTQIKEAVHAVRESHRGGNTHLGICLLFVPLAAGAGAAYVNSHRLDPRSFRRSVRQVTEGTTSEDALRTYEAIGSLSRCSLGRLRRVRAPDILNRDSMQQILNQGFTLYDAMRVSSRWDNIAREWVTGMSISFEVGYPEFSKILAETNDVNAATVQTFLTILSHYPDTLIARKHGLSFTDDIITAVRLGLPTAKRVSDVASKVLRLGGILTKKGRAALRKFDRDLRSPRNELNPGTTADLTASSIMIALLCGSKI